MPLAWIALNSIKGLGPVRIKHLLEKYGSPDAIFRELPSRIAKLGGIPEICAAQLSNPELFREAERQLRWAAKYHCTVMPFSDQNYPPYLKEIFAPPPILYVKGNTGVFAHYALAVVGTRTPTSYGKQVTSIVTRDLVEHKLAIVSGLARGIDTIAHQACISKGGATIAVLGSGLDKIYPQVNTELAEAISERGALVSEFPMGTSPEAFNFPRRNRIISGLSAGVIVVEAGERSGSLITAHYALQQGREVFAIPGPVTSLMSNGTFNLLKEGATPARNGHEIAEALKVVMQPTINFNSHTSCPSPKLTLNLLSDQEKSVLEQLSTLPVRIDELVEKTGLALVDLFNLLLNLELKGLIKQISGQQFVKIE